MATKTIEAPVDEEQHYLIDGEQYVRVTTVLETVMGGPKSGMAYWGANRFADYIEAVTTGTEMETTAEDVYREFLDSPFNPDKVKKAAGQRGKDAHKLFERLILGEVTLSTVKDVDWIDDGDIVFAPASYDLGVVRAYKDVVSGIEGVQPEQRVYSEMYGFAGTADVIAGSVVLDVKTHKPPARFTDFVQMSAYSLAWEEMTGTKIDTHVVILAQEDGTYETYHGFVDPLAFLSCLELYHMIEDWEVELGGKPAS